MSDNLYYDKLCEIHGILGLKAGADTVGAVKTLVGGDKLDYSVVLRGRKPKTTLTISDIFEAIEKTEYVVLSGTTTTVCVLTLVNGFVVTGTSACVDPKNFNQAEGEKYAFEKATDEVWKLEGYLLKQRLYEGGRNHG